MPSLSSKDLQKPEETKERSLHDRSTLPDDQLMEIHPVTPQETAARIEALKRDRIGGELVAIEMTESAGEYKAGKKYEVSTSVAHHYCQVRKIAKEIARTKGRTDDRAMRPGRGSTRTKGK